MALTQQQTQTARFLYGLATSRGISPRRALEVVNAAYSESGLNPGARNKTSGAGGLFQLLSPGYVNKANQMGGVNNPRANALAILPNYQSYWRSHPNAAPGEAARDVERSGQGSGFYSGALGQIQQAVGRVGQVGSLAPPGAAQPSAMAAPGVNPRAALAQNLIAANQASSRGQAPDYSQTLSLVAAVRNPQTGTSIPVVSQGSVAPAAAQKAVMVAKQYLNTPYKWGGASPKTGFDCSGLLQYAWGKAGIKIPRTSQQQFLAGHSVNPRQLQAGDAVFFEGGPSGPGHVGMMVDNKHFIESPHTGAVVRVSTLAGRGDFVGARRY